METILWYIFRLVPYVIRTKDYTIKFYGTVENCQKFDKYINSLVNPR